MEDNILISKFLGWETWGSGFRSVIIPKDLIPHESLLNFEKADGSKHWSVETPYLKFNSDWNWLMQVVAKIEKELPCDSVILIEYKDCTIPVLNDEEPFDIHCYAGTKIEAVYQACLEFVEWYNKQ